ncbi:MAG: carboxypeptidase-like regulatory domain-containing protein, partial [Planctomycetota bacterium]|nr:carboxypeptidase-like regulatory domain-containing protein [Planctomycetota bacterium]
MKPFFVLLLVAAAAGSLFLALNKDAPGPAQDDPGRVAYEAPEEDTTAPSVEDVPDLSPVDTGDDRENVAPEVASTLADATPMTTLAGYGDLTGKVTDAGGAGLSGAQVTLTIFGSQSFNFFEDVDRSKDVTTGTDEEGRFMFRRVPIREGYSLIATHPDFSRTELAGVFVRDGEVTESADIVMGKGRALRGRITDSSGSPVPGARLVLNQDMFGASFEGGSRVDQLETSSDEQGGYEFSNVAPQQNYALTVVAEGYGKVILPTIAVLETEDTVKDIVLEVASLLAGQVISQSGEPIEGVSVEAWAM